MSNLDFTRPFLDYYRKYKISPVSQDISNLSKHFDRRDSLYRHLGIPPKLIRGKSVIEFGPGSGHNSIFTCSLEPARYVLVDGNPTGLLSVKKFMAQFGSDRTRIQCVESLIEEYEDDLKYDLVLCEGVLSRQKNPVALLMHIGKLVAPGGLLVITCVDSVSLFSEFLRKIMGDAIVADLKSLKDKVEKLLPLFKPHLDTLIGMSRPHSDWIIDNILQPLLVEKVFSVPEAIEAVSPDFDVYNFSPNFVTDWRWYKDIWGEEKYFNKLAVEHYYRNVQNFIDYRFVMPERSKDLNSKLINVCNELPEIAKRFQDSKDPNLLFNVVQLAKRTKMLTSEFSPKTAEAIEDYICSIQHYIDKGCFIETKKCASWFGRGMQYLSFIKAVDHQI